MPGLLTPAAFVAKWQRAKLSERAASQEHFIDLCRLLGQPTPAEHDATGAEYTFEKGITIAQASADGQREGGFADVWWKDKFGWEYKRKDKYRTLDEAYAQLQRYREALNNPPLLIVCDIARTEIHTNFNNTANETHTITLDDIADGPGLDKLRRVFTNPESFRPAKTTEQVTLAVAKAIGNIAQRLQKAGHDPHAVAHYLMKCMFCLFAEKVPGLLPERLFKNLLNRNRQDPDRFKKRAADLFKTMATGGDFGADQIPYFNGGLFDDAPPIELSFDDLGVLDLAANQDWAHIEPSILGTLFERSLDPDKRAQIGAHYTSKEDILLVIDPVIMQPLRKEWQKLKTEIESELQSIAAGGSPRPEAPAIRTRSVSEGRSGAPEAKERTKKPLTPLNSIHQQISQFLAQLSSLKILDPACGSGNFLYVAIQQLLALEKEIITFAAQPPISLRLLPRVRPTQLLGIEINPYAAELAQVSIWIGFLQWLHLNGFPVATDTPILSKIQTIENRDAILDFNSRGSGSGKIAHDKVAAATAVVGAISNNAAKPRQGRRNTPAGADSATSATQALATPAQWPDAHFIIGNPPFLGGNLIRQGLGDEYVNALFKAYDLPKFSDLCCYWFELARRKIEKKSTRKESITEPSLPRVGLLATQAIRGGVNRTVLERIKAKGDIFYAWADREWILEGAAVNVSMVGFDDGTEPDKELNGSTTSKINADLTANVDLREARVLPENLNLQHEGDKKGADFDIEYTVARRILASPAVSGNSLLDVCRPWWNGLDITRRPRSMWIVDFPPECSLAEAAKYDSAFEYIKKAVSPKYAKTRNVWWIHERPRPEMRVAIGSIKRMIATARLAKHRLFQWLPTEVLPDSQIVVFARSDDYFLGMLHSTIHELWSLRHGTQLEDRPRYTPTTTFETFPFPWPPGKEPTKHPAYKRIAAAAKELNDLRERWLNPPELLAPLAQILDAQDKFLDVPKEARALIRHSALMAEAAKSPNLKKRTLTNLYNERPTWLKLAHEKLDRAVLAAYAAVDPEGHWHEDWAALYTETGAGHPLPKDHPLAAQRAEVDQKILANLLRLNHDRAA